MRKLSHSRLDIKNYKTFLNNATQKFKKEFKQKGESKCTLKDFNIIMILGHGTYANVMLAKKKNTNKQYAIKVLDKKKILKLGVIHHTRNEKDILLAINHPFVIMMEFFFTDNSYIYFVLPFLPGGDMFGLIRKKKHLSEYQSKFYAAQVCLALEYLHTINLIHRDIKPENILIGENGYLKVADFGFCKLVPGRTYTFCGTPEYIAPEILLNRGYGRSVDWWAFGVLIYEMNAGFAPFTDQTTLLLYDKILSGNFKCPAHFNGNLINLVNNIIQVDLTKRYGNLSRGIRDIKEHSWFKEIKWLSMLNKHSPVPYKPTVKGIRDGRNLKNLDSLVSNVASKNLFKKEFEFF